MEFKAPHEWRGQRLTLTFEGVNYAAEVWLNGQKLGGFTGAFLHGRFDVTSLVAATGERILPAYYSENYVSLLPGEERTITVEFPAGTPRPAIALRGWNLTAETVKVD